MLPDDLTQEPEPAVLAALAVCHGAALEREGIAMYVALPDARPGRTEAPAGSSSEGPRLAELFAHYHDALAEGHPAPAAHESPDSPDATAEARLIDALVVLSERHLHARPQRSTRP